MIRRFVVLFCAIVLLPVSAASAHWREARSPSFLVYSDGGEEELRRSAALLDDFDRLLRTLTETPLSSSPAPLKVYLVGSVDKLRQVSDAPDGTLGFYLARVGGTAAFAVRGDQPGLGGEEVLLHEYAHHFMSFYYPAAYPAWYREGFAEYVMTARLLPDRIEIGRYNPSRAVTLLRGTWLPVDRILSRGRDGLSAAQLPQFYAESWLITHYLFAAPGRLQALARYFADMQRGTDESVAFRAAFGMDHRAFEADLKRYMNGRLGFGTISRDQTALPVPSIRILPASADDLLLRQVALNMGISDIKRETETIEAIRVAARRFPEDDFAKRVLGRAEIGSGDRAAGIAAIEALLARSPTDSELLYYRGLADFFSGRSDRARQVEFHAAANRWFERAAQADASSYPALYRQALTTATAGTGPSDETIRQLQAAHALAPLVGDIAIDAATALATKRRYAEAEAAILPIATDPHGGNSDRARSLLEDIQSRASRQ